MNIYLDNCSLNRPYDNQNAARVRLEAEAVQLILAAIANDQFKLVWSQTLDLENDQNPFEERRTGVARWKHSASTMVKDDADIRNQARELVRHGFKPLDALHLASAISGKASHFLTVDDKILKKYKLVAAIVIISPLEFAQAFGEKL